MNKLLSTTLIALSVAFAAGCSDDSNTASKEASKAEPATSVVQQKPESKKVKQEKSPQDLAQEVTEKYLKYYVKLDKENLSKISQLSFREFSYFEKFDKLTPEELAKDEYYNEVYRNEYDLYKLGPDLDLELVKTKVKPASKYLNEMYYFVFKDNNSGKYIQVSRLDDRSPNLLTISDEIPEFDF